MTAVGGTAIEDVSASSHDPSALLACPGFEWLCASEADELLDALTGDELRQRVWVEMMGRIYPPRRLPSAQPAKIIYSVPRGDGTYQVAYSDDHRPVVVDCRGIKPLTPA